MVSLNVLVHCKRLEGFWKSVEQFICPTTERKNITVEKVALYGVLGCDINLVLLVAKMCKSKVTNGIARNSIVVFETERVVRKKYFS